MTPTQLNELNQLLLKIELVLVDGRRFLAQAQAEAQADAERAKKVAEVKEKKE